MRLFKWSSPFSSGELHSAAGHRFEFHDDGSQGPDGTAFHLAIFHLDIEAHEDAMLEEALEDDDESDACLVGRFMRSAAIDKLLDMEGRE